MILTCPACTMRYLVSEGSIGPNGRRVRCANCGHTWTQEPEEGLDEELFSEPPAFLENIPEEEDPFESRAPENPREEDFDISDDDFQSILRKEIESSPIPAGVHPDLEDPVLAQLVKDRKMGNLPKGQKLGGYVTAAIIYLAILGVLFFFHLQISRAWPPSNLLYNLVGLKPVMPGAGLTLDNLKAEMANGKITMKGDIFNLKDIDVKVPAVIASIVGDDGKVIDQVLIAPPISRIKPEGQASFDVVYPKIPEGATNVTFAFSFLNVEPVPEKPKPTPEPIEKVGETPKPPAVDTPAAETPAAESPPAPEEQSAPADAVPPITDEHPAETAKPVTAPLAPDAVMTPADPEPSPAH